MSDQQPPELTDEQIAQFNAEMDRIHVDEVILQTLVTLIQLGARKGAVGAPPEAGVTPDSEQLRIAIDAARALLAVVEPRHGNELGPLRDAISQLQLAYAQQVGGAPPTPPAPPAEPQPQGGTTPAPSRLWVPGQ